MNKKRNLSIIAISIILVIISILIIKNISDTNNKKNHNEMNDVNYKNYTSKYNEDNGKYEIYDSETGKLLGSYETEEGANEGLEIYRDNPGYDATPPVSPNAE